MPSHRNGTFSPACGRSLNYSAPRADEGRVALPVESHSRWVWAVLDHEGRVVLLVSGEGAWAEAQEWAARGYRVTEARLAD
jgi:hypothetical protein